MAVKQQAKNFFCSPSSPLEANYYISSLGIFSHPLKVEKVSKFIYVLLFWGWVDRRHTYTLNLLFPDNGCVTRDDLTKNSREKLKIITFFLALDSSYTSSACV